MEFHFTCVNGSLSKVWFYFYYFWESIREIKQTSFLWASTSASEHKEARALFHTLFTPAPLLKILLGHLLILARRCAVRIFARVTIPIKAFDNRPSLPGERLIFLFPSQILLFWPAYRCFLLAPQTLNSAQSQIQTKKIVTRKVCACGNIFTHTIADCKIYGNITCNNLVFAKPQNERGILFLKIAHLYARGGGYNDTFCAFSSISCWLRSSMSAVSCWAKHPRVRDRH